MGQSPDFTRRARSRGIFYGTAPNAVAVLRALVFGRIAGREAIGFLQQQKS